MPNKAIRLCVSSTVTELDAALAGVSPLAVINVTWQK
jgi:hypothetical protein